VLGHDRRGALGIAGLAGLALALAGWTGSADGAAGPGRGVLGVAVAGTVAVAGVLAEATRRAEADALSAERAASHRALAHARDAAASARTQRSELIASMSHELRTPLDGILGVSDFLLRTGLDRAQRDHVETIRASANALVEQIDDLLDVGRIEAGAAPIAAAPFDPVALARQVADLLRARAREKGVRLAVDIAPRVPARVIGDAGRLRQVLLNLVGNGVKYTHEGGVTLRVSVAEDPGALPLLRFDVEDTGIGIAREDHERIFDRFTEAGEHARSIVGGTGLGLSISRHLVARMGGAIHVESEPGVGSRFRVELRLPAEAGEPASHDALPPLPPARILVAEDNPLSRKVTVAMLDHLGCIGDTAVHGEAAVQLATTNRYDLVLMDCEMPIVDGLEATRRLRAAGATYPIVALTAHVLPEVRRRCEDAGLDDVLEKPVRLERLHRVLARWLIGP
jgi:signal transduction histidine kinase/CheY-like chemotaxis protein